MSPLKMNPCSFTALVLTAFVSVGCGAPNPADNPLAPYLKGAAGPVSSNENGAPGGGASAPVVTSHYEQAAKDQCLGAWSWKQVKYAVCSNQGGFSFLDFSGSDFQHPETLKILRKGRDGSLRANYENPRVAPTSGGRTDLVFSTYTEFRGVNFSKSSPDLGYVVLEGNSGSCSPLLSGTAATCYAAFKAYGSSYSDKIPVPSFHFTVDSVTRVDGCDLKKIKDSSGSDDYTGIDTFAIASAAPCLLAGRLRQPGARVSYDMKKPENYPLLKSPQS